jgi:hypothetical protein
VAAIVPAAAWGTGPCTGSGSSAELLDERDIEDVDESCALEPWGRAAGDDQAPRNVGASVKTSSSGWVVERLEGDGMSPRPAPYAIKGEDAGGNKKSMEVPWPSRYLKRKGNTVSSKMT